MVTDQFALAGHSFEGFLGTASRDLANRTLGVTAELGRRFRDEPPPSDEILVERIRATIGHHVRIPGPSRSRPSTVTSCSAARSRRASWTD